MDFGHGWPKSQMLTKVKLWPKLIYGVPWMNEAWNEFELDVDGLMDNEVIKWYIHEVNFQSKSPIIEANGHD